MWVTVWLSFVIVTVTMTTAEKELESSFLKRLSQFQKKAKEKRGMQTVVAHPDTESITIYFIACVKGDRSTDQCDPSVTRHYWQLIEYDADNHITLRKWGETKTYVEVDPVTGAHGPIEKVEVKFVEGHSYVVLACEVTVKGQYQRCNQIRFNGKGKGHRFPSYVKDPDIIKDAGTNRLPVR